MEERRQFGFRVRPNYGQALGYIQEGEPITLELPKRNASVYMASHFYLDDADAPHPHQPRGGLRGGRPGLPRAALPRAAQGHAAAAQLLFGQQQRFRGRGPRPGATHGRLRRAAALDAGQPAAGVGHLGRGDGHRRHRPQGAAVRRRSHDPRPAPRRAVAGQDASHS